MAFFLWKPHQGFCHSAYSNSFSLHVIHLQVSVLMMNLSLPQ